MGKKIGNTIVAQAGRIDRNKKEETKKSNPLTFADMYIDDKGKTHLVFNENVFKYLQELDSYKESSKVFTIAYGKPAINVAERNIDIQVLISMTKDEYQYWYDRDNK